MSGFYNQSSNGPAEIKKEKWYKNLWKYLWQLILGLGVTILAAIILKKYFNF